jgi:hypothetical protein
MKGFAHDKDHPLSIKGSAHDITKQNMRFAIISTSEFWQRCRVKGSGVRVDGPGIETLLMPKEF